MNSFNKGSYYLVVIRLYKLIIYHAANSMPQPGMGNFKNMAFEKVEIDFFCCTYNSKISIKVSRFSFQEALPGLTWHSGMRSTSNYLETRVVTIITYLPGGFILSY